MFGGKKLKMVVGILAVGSLGHFAPSAGAEEAVMEPIAASERKASLFLYVGQYSSNRFNQIVRFNADFESSWVAVAGVSRELMTLGPHLVIEGEGQLGQHWGQQSHQEINGLVAFRWTRFPWNETVPTSVAYASGLSFAFQRPNIEQRRDQEAERLLKYLMVELEAGLPHRPDLSLFFRIHHRSGVFGILSDARGSNFVGFGIRNRF